MDTNTRERWWLVLAGAAALIWLGRRQRAHYADLRAQQAAHQRQLLYESRENSRQAQALMWLYQQLDFEAPLPPMRGYAISPDFAVLLVDLLREHQPQNVLEFGSGTSTLIIAKVLQQLGTGGHVVAVEAEKAFAEGARDILMRHHLAEIGAVVHAGLKHVRVDGRAWQWYDPRAFHFVKDIDFLVVDGPNQYNSRQRMVRYPALPLLKDRLRPGAIIVVDDAKRGDERRMVERWLDDESLRVLARYDESEKGATVLQYGG